jgi:hypothetical protein
MSTLTNLQLITTIWVMVTLANGKMTEVIDDHNFLYYAAAVSFTI